MDTENTKPAWIRWFRFYFAHKYSIFVIFISSESTIDMEQIFNRVEHAKENSQIWIFVKSPFITNKPHAVGVAAMAQTKVIEIFNL